MLGFHCHHSNPVGIRKCISWSKKSGINIECLQIFVTGAINAKTLVSLDDYEEMRKITDDMPIVIHGSYLDNTWNSSSFSEHHILRELNIANNIGAVGVIIHLARKTTDNFFDVIKKLDEQAIPSDAHLILEINSAKSSEYTFETPEKLNVLIDKINLAKPKNFKIGLCIDTAHLAACGVALKSYDEAKQWFNATHLNKLDFVMFHINDSRAPIGSGRDVHHTILKGNIWSDYEECYKYSGLHYIFIWAAKHNSMMILERHEGEVEEDFKVLQKNNLFILQIE